jgi:cytochrome c551/c552
MNRMKFVGALLFAMQFAVAQAEPLSITLPPETAALKPSTLPGYAMAQQKCSTCHSADYINFQPPGMSLEQWTAEASKMKNTYGAPITDEDVNIIGAYLATTYGAAQASDAAVQTASYPTKAEAAPAAKSDAMALLQNNACLSCHALDHKVVGPSYHEVAAKYSGDAQALEKVTASIQQGGAGKWGNVPMPAFAQLNADDLKTLATFILQQ